ncbi:transcription initiation factor TFIID subunit 12-like [Pocillopora damicornis]|uniref:transcription initiation factor TFIID subunit 12-like n=1 Tax=Pocillopora damicornis TaxID=46731 RepID=UPI000F54F452|nr:transcription initiation factor TFIID subunit 12-like [Pocillopora damicornis]XP_027048724.1 transcription initiation factor TFIID subunit 12-like [Pocillopora damicornis]XP_027048732.1 transcription initiation factor TFIID subunit 12-like [Pocillopora damicornis]
MASLPTVTTASSSPKTGQQKSIVEVLQDIQKRIQGYGLGPYTPEQAKEVERLKVLFRRLKAENEKAIQEGKIAVMRTTTVMTPVTQVLVPTHVAAPNTMQMTKIAPATTALPNQQTTVLPATTVTGGIPVGQASLAAKTILPQTTTLQPIQPQNVVINPASIQQLQRTADGIQRTVKSPQPTTLQVTQTLAPGQQIAVRTVAPAQPGQGIKPTVTLTNRPMQVASGVTQTVTLQRHLAPNKSPVHMPITLAPSGTVSAAVPSGGHVTNIAPAPISAAVSKGISTQAAGTALRGDSSSPAPNQVLTKRRLQDLLHEIDPREQMDDDVEDLLLQIADDFIESVVTASCQIAKHRKSNTLEVRDVQLHLERCWNMWIPGFGSDELRPFKKQATTEAHKQRLALIRKSMKK